jgi:hypothetical protein
MTSLEILAGHGEIFFLQVWLLKVSMLVDASLVVLVP